MRILPVVGLLLASQAHAFTEPDSGGWLGGAGGLVANSNGVGPGWQASGGIWFGKHDPAYALGKYGGVGVTVRQGLLHGELLTEPMLEGRFGADIVVVTTQVFASVGPHVRAGSVGATALFGAGLKYRVTARFGITGRAELGATYWDGAPLFRSNVVFGIEWMSPWKRRE